MKPRSREAVGEGFADLPLSKQPLTPGFAVPSPLGEGRYQLRPRWVSKCRNSRGGALGVCVKTAGSWLPWGFSQSITVSSASNPPNTTIFVSGSGFSAGADVDIYFDTTDLALAVTDGTGSFSQIALRVPASALPGEHMVSAVDRSTGASA